MLTTKLPILRLRLLSLIDQKMKYYAVAKGRKVGIYNTWADCEAQVKGSCGALFKKFNTYKEAEDFIANSGKKSTTENKTTSSVSTKQDFWPDDVESNTADDALLLSALSTAAPEPQTTKKGTKRKAEPYKPQKTGEKKFKQELITQVGVKKFGEYEFPVDSEEYVIVYTDGSCENNGQKNAIAGLGVYFADNHPLNAAKPVRGRATNNCGEIQAASEAIRIAKSHGIQKLCISTDSQFLLNSITSWIGSWKQRNWTLKNGQAVKNVLDFKELDELLSDKTIKVKWNYVPGHVGILGNERADKLAREGGYMYKKLHKI